jgi:hypothetical protein
MLAACALPTAAAAFPIGSASLSRNVAAGSPVTAVVREHVGSNGVYDLKVTVATRGTDREYLDVDVGPLARRARVDRRADLAKLRLLLAIDRSSFTVRVPNARPGTVVRTSLVRISALAPGVAAGVIAPAVEPAGRGSARPSGPVTKSSAAGPTGSTGSTGSSGAVGPVAPVVAPVAPPVAVQPPLVASFAPDGAPILALPNGFTPIVNYSNPVKDYEFNGSTLPSDFTASANNSHGAHATMYQPSAVTMTGSSVALTATPQASDGFPYTSGYISTQGQYSFNYGLIDYRAIMPPGQGLWSGLWLDQPDASNPWGEIDVQEMLLNNTDTIYGSAHGWAPSDWGETQSTIMSANATTGYHDYQLAWQPGLLTWAVDGIAYAQYSENEAIAHGYPWVFDDGTGFYIIASLTVGAADEWPGAPNATTTFPATMQVQSIKLWQ